MIGDEIGEFIEVDFESDDLAAGRFLRLKVRLDICKPLMRGTTVNLGEGRGDRWCPIAYEFGDGARNQELRVSFSGRGGGPGSWLAGGSGSQGSGVRSRSDALSWRKDEGKDVAKKGGNGDAEKMTSLLKLGAPKESVEMDRGAAKLLAKTK